jgi:hypothetical protein
MLYASRRWTVLAAAVLVVVSLSAGSPAGANSPRITRGDVEAIFQATPNGGWAVLLHSPTGQGAPFDAQDRGAIRPLSFNDGKHYCAEDWHVILFAMIVGGDASFTRPEAEAILDSVVLSFTLDGAPLPTTRTTVKRFLNPAPDDVAYAVQEGRIMAPSDLSVGGHQLAVTISEPGFPTEVLEITFFVDAAGTGACL